MININLLPKNLRRVREPGYWRLLAIAFPLLVFGIIFVLQFLAVQTETNLKADVQNRTDQLNLLQDAINERNALIARQQQLNRLIDIQRAVQENRIIWTEQISGMLETLPSGSINGRPIIDFRNLNVRAVDPPSESEERFEGASVNAEMTVSGNVDGTDVLSDFVRALEDSSRYGVLFQNAARQGDTDIFSYNLTIGSLTGGGDEPR